MSEAFRTYVSESGIELTDLSNEEKLQWRRAFDDARVKMPHLAEQPTRADVKPPAAQPAPVVTFSLYATHH